jgi:osomolarity two-component system response regulator SKN7
MNDVLPKPFTKDGMLRALEKHLPQFKKSAQFAAGQMPPGYVSASQLSTVGNQVHQPLGLNMGQLSATQSLKDDASPGKSPATASSWHSPSQLPNQSPIGAAPANYMQTAMRESPYAMAPMSSQPGFPGGPNPGMPGPRAQPHRRVVSDISGGQPDEHPDSKRQRMFPPGQVNFPQ